MLQSPQLNGTERFMEPLEDCKPLLDLFFRSTRSMGIEDTAIQHAVSKLRGTNSDIIQQYVAATYNLCHDEAIGVRLAASTQMVAVSSLVYLMMSSATLGVALDCLTRYAGIIVQRRANLKSYWNRDRYHLQYCDIGTNRHFADYAGALIVRLCRHVVSDEIFPLEVRFLRTSPANAEPYRRIFGENIEFNCDRNELIWTRQQLATLSRHANPALHVLHENAVIKEHQSMTAFTVVREVRDRIAADIGAHTNLATTAAKIGVTPRTLQRYLRAHNMDFKTLLTAARKERALALVRDSAIEINSIASLLGYSSSSVFFRAFRKWTGTTPLRLRRQRA